MRTLAGMVAGIVASERTSLPRLALKTPDSTKAQSRTKRFERFLRDESTTFGAFYEPFARKLVSDLSKKGAPLLIVFDSSSIGRGCAALMASVLYGKRALPLAWTVRKGKKGHFSGADHRLLLRRIQHIIPEKASAIFLGDGYLLGRRGVRLGRVAKSTRQDRLRLRPASTTYAGRPSRPLLKIGVERPSELGSFVPFRESATPRCTAPLSLGRDMGRSR